LLTVQASAAGTIPFTPSADTFLVSAIANAGKVAVSKDPSVTWAALLAPSATLLERSTQLTIASALIATNLKIPVFAGEVEYVAFGSAGIVTFYFDDGVV
jgi:phosphohistidine swiveling domain-containing protein